MASTGYRVDVRKRRRIAKERAFVPLLGSDYGATLNAVFEEPKNPPFWFLKIFAVDSNGHLSKTSPLIKAYHFN